MPFRWLALSGCLAFLAVLSACSGPALLNAVTSRAGYTVVNDIRYAPGERGTYDLYVPDGADATTPVVVFFYGGGWDSGAKGTYPFVGQSLASDGVIVAIPDYRVFPEVQFPAFVEDGAKAVAAVAQAVREGRHGLVAGAHPLFLMGHSAGAQIAALLSLDRHYLADAGLAGRPLAGLIGLAGPYDFLPLTDERYKRVFPPRLRPASQPVNFVTAAAPPMLLVAGAADTTVKPDNSRSLAEKVRAAGGSATVDIRPGVDHIGAVSGLATALPLGDRTIRATVLAFIKEHS
jgi:acetyl esterase/lipase